MRRMSAAAAATVLLTLGATITATTTAAVAATPSATHDDFNGDGYRDLVVSAPGGTVSGQKAAGYVAVLYGSASGVSTSRRATFSMSTPGIEGIAEAEDRFGQTTATGDIDRDGFDDLIIGAPGKDIGTAYGAGSATILFGSATGLHGADSRWLHNSAPVRGERFGMGMAAGWFKGDDTSVAILTETNLMTYSFEVTPNGRTMTTDISPITLYAPAGFNPVSLTAANYDKDEAADLVLLGTESYGDGGVTGVSVEVVGGRGGWERGIRLDGGGPVGASGDLNKDGYPDLALGSPVERDSNGDLSSPGVVYVYFGGPNGLGGLNGNFRQFWTQNSSGVPGVNKIGDRFGGALAVRDIDGDGYGDLAIGAPGNDIGSATDAGTVWVMHGSATGPTTRGIRTLSQDSWRVPGTPEKGDQFGGALRLIDLDRDGKADLVASAPGENTDDGAVWVFPATGTGPATTRSWSFGAKSLHAPVPDARFGETLAP